MYMNVVARSTNIYELKLSFPKLLLALNPVGFKFTEILLSQRIGLSSFHYYSDPLMAAVENHLFFLLQSAEHQNALLT